MIMDLEKNNVKTEMENHLESGRDELLKRAHGLAVLENWKLEEKLNKSEKECEELRKKIATLTADRVFDNGVIRTKTEEGYGDVSLELNKTRYEKNQIAADLNNKLREFKNLILEKDRILGVCHDRLKGFERDVAEMEKEVEKLKHFKWEDNRIIEEMSVKLSEYYETMERIRREKLEADRAMEELRRQKLEAEHAIEEMVRKLLKSDNNVEELRRAVKKLEHRNLTVCKNAEMHKEKFENLAPLAEEIVNLLKMKVDDLADIKNKLVATEGDEGAEPILGNDSKHGEGNSVRSPKMRSTCNSVERGCNGLPERGPHTQFKISASEQSQNETWCSVETTPSSAAAKDIIEIIDCDDETNAGENPDAYVSDLCTNLGETGIICEKFVSSPSLNQTNKRNRIDCSELPHIIPQRKRSKLGVEANNNSPIRKWMFGADMLKAFQEDDELCMNAVCALYRQKVSASKFTEGSNRVFYHFETLRGCDLAEYLIDGDPELRLTKSVREVKQQSPEVINQCRRLATDHYESLFMLYCNGDDPFFGST